MTRRMERLNRQIQEEIADLLLRQVKDPRLSGLVSVTRVSVSPDMRQAMVFISSLGDEAQRRMVMEGMTEASGFLRRELGHRLSLRRIPELVFKRDDSLEKADQVMKLLRQAGLSPEEGKTEARERE